MPDQQQDELSQTKEQLPEEERPRPQRTVDIKPKPLLKLISTKLVLLTKQMPCQLLCQNLEVAIS